MFDKTGTLTKGEFGVTNIVKLSDWSEKEILETAAAIEVNSEHAIARAIVKKARKEGLQNKTAKQFTAIPEWYSCAKA